MIESDGEIPFILENTKKLDSPSTVWPFKTDHVDQWAYWERAFSESECDQLIELGNSINSNKATVGSDESVNPEIRLSEVSWIVPTAETDWLFRRITDITTSLNDRFFQFELFGLAEGLQFTKYIEPGGYYGKHTDSMFGTRVRKLSFTLQLSDPEDYEGGELLLYFGDKPRLMSKARGDVSIFPSYTLHEVTPVTSGVRYSLVAWVTGRPFK